MKWGLVCKPNAKKALNIAKDVYDFLLDKGEVFAEKNLSKDLKVKGHTLKNLNDLSDVIITIGGDGTILMTAQEVEKPIFAINSGGMGFLAEVESKYAIGSMNRLIEGKYNIEERSKLKVTLNGERLPDALNEATVQTDRIAKILYLKIFVDNELIESIGADGVIVATPTGSTSYALSVGGPIIDPAVSGMIIAPIAPFKLSTRPWIVPLKRKVGIKLMPRSKESKIVIDGRHSKSVSSDSEIIITGSEKKARFIRFGESFYQMVRLKLIR